MIANPRAQALLLLTLSLGGADRDAAKPLSAREWSRLSAWLDDRGLDPAALLTDNPRNVLPGWEDRAIAHDRLDRLLGRGAALGLALEKWQRAGLWLLTRDDSDYPTRLRRRLGHTAPPVLFGCGGRPLLERGGLAVVGSRDASEDDIAFSQGLGRAASRQGLSIVSGGARGVDRSAMKGAIDSEGTVVAVLADNLLRAATSALYRRPLLSGDLALICVVNPEARFHVGNAMARNRYIYCLADAAVVVASARGSGGTWNGACENATAGWVPLWVRRTADSKSGNRDLTDRGARWLPDPLASVGALFERPDAAPVPAAAELFEEALPLSASEPGSMAQSPAIPDGPEFFDLFLVRLEEHSAGQPLAEADIVKRLQIAKGQIKLWLDRGVAQGRIEKLKRPVRYRAPHPERPLPLGPSAPGSSARFPGAGIPGRLGFDDLFQQRIEGMTAAEPCSSSDIAQALGIAPGQVNEWLKRGVAEGRIRKTTGPVRYRGTHDPRKAV